MRRGRGKAILLVVVIWALIAGVGAFVAMRMQKNEDEEAAEKIKEAADMMDEDITSGQFVIDGVMYQFPMDLQFWLDNGWHVSNNYENKDEFELEAGAVSNEFELFNDEEDFVRVSVINTSDEDAKVEKCMVYTLYMSMTEVDAVFPGGINKSSKPDEVLDEYGDPLSKGDESSMLEAVYSYTSEDSWKCVVELDVVDNNYTIDPFTSVSYSIQSFGTMWDGLISEYGADGLTKIFIDSAMKASYWGDLEEYLEYGIDSESNAQELYESEVVYFAQYLMYYADLYTDYMTDEDLERVYNVAAEALSKVKWNIKDIEINVFNEGTVTLEMYPTDFFYIVEDDIYNAVEEYNTKYADVDFEALSDEEYIAIEQEYIEKIISAMEERVKEAGTLEVVEKQYKVDLNENIVSDTDWEDIDDTIMNLIEE